MTLLHYHSSHSARRSRPSVSRVVPDCKGALLRIYRGEHKKMVHPVALHVKLMQPSYKVESSDPAKITILE